MEDIYNKTIKEMKRIFHILLLLALIGAPMCDMYAQKKKTKDKIEMPEYPGGTSALQQFILSEVRYPTEARINGDMGEVLIGFTIDAQGALSGVRVLRSVSKALDEEAVRVVKKMRYWIPGKRNGRPVRAEMSIPINFKVVVENNKYINDDENSSKHSEEVIKELLH